MRRAKTNSIITRIKFHIKNKRSIDTNKEKVTKPPVIRNQSDTVKEFISIAYKMNPGSFIECTRDQRKKIYNYLRSKNVHKNFIARTIDKENKIMAIHCIKKTRKKDLI